MIVLMLTGLQAGAAVAGPLASAPVPAPLRIIRPCPQPTDNAGDVVVCGRAGEAERYRLRQLPPMAEQSALPKAETRVLGNARLSAETEAVSVGGFVSNRAMVRLKFGF